MEGFFKLLECMPLFKKLGIEHVVLQPAIKGSDRLLPPWAAGKVNADDSHERKFEGASSSDGHRLPRHKSRVRQIFEDRQFRRIMMGEL